jgi:hypothetical protein
MTKRTAAAILADVLVWPSLFLLCQCLTQAACFVDWLRYQPGAPHQKEAISTTTAPYRTPDVAQLAAARF